MLRRSWETKKNIIKELNNRLNENRIISEQEQTNLEKLEAWANKYNDRYKYNFFRVLNDKDFVNSLSQNVLDAYYGLAKSSCGVGTTIPKLLESVKKIQSKKELLELDTALRKKPICGNYESLDDVLNGELGAYDKETIDTIKNYFEGNNIATLNYGVSSRGYWKQGTIQITVSTKEEPETEEKEEPETSNTWDNYPCVTDGEKATLKDGSISYGKRLTTQSEYPYGWFYMSGKVKLYTSENESKMYDYKCQDGKIEIEGYEIKKTKVYSEVSDIKTLEDIISKEKSIKNGNSGDVVKEIQQSLLDLKYDIGGTEPDGKFGTKTKGAVKKFQKDNGLTDDGIVGPKTAQKIKDVLFDKSKDVKNIESEKGTDYAADTSVKPKDQEIKLGESEISKPILDLMKRMDIIK